MISDPSKTLAEGAITPWRRGTKRMQAYYQHLQKALVKHFHVDEDMPFSELPEQFKQALYFGTNGTPIEMDFSDKRSRSRGKSCKTIRGTGAADAAAIRADSKQIHSQPHSLVHDLRTMQSMQWCKAQTRNPRSPIIHKRKKLLTRTPSTIFWIYFLIVAEDNH
jgi:excinuclease UvrABC ATPase subunit